MHSKPVSPGAENNNTVILSVIPYLVRRQDISSGVNLIKIIIGKLDFFLKFLCEYSFVVKFLLLFLNSYFRLCIF